MKHRLPDTAVTPLMELVGKRTTTQQLQDPFRDVYTIDSANPAATILQPAYDPGKLILAALQSSSLNQCIDAYVVNIESYGYQLEYLGKQGTEDGLAARKQKAIAMAFCDSPNGDRTLRQVREQSRKDFEYTGNRYFEIMRDMAGRIVHFDHVPSPTIRMTKRDARPTAYTTYVRDPSTGDIVEKTAMKYFRRYVQMGSMGQKVFFKEFGDPRSIDPKDGLVNDSLTIEEQATEIYHHLNYIPGSPYGLPRWIGALKAMLGAQESEAVNLNFFRENAIPAMAVLISGGALTEESFDSISNIINAARGKDAMNRILILEAASDDSVGSTDQAPPAPKIELKPMISERQQEGLFKEYEQEAKKKIRSSMRLPAIYTGDSEEYTKATAQSGQRIAESQVFFPERTIFDEFVNSRVFPTLGVSLWRFKTMGPTVYDPESLGTLVDRFARHGALTPNILVKLANTVLDVQIPNIQDKWGDVPFNYLLGAMGQGMVVDGFEDVLSVIHDTAADATGNTDPNANDNGQKQPAKPGNQPSAAKALQMQIRRELRAVSNEMITAVNEAMSELRAAA